MNRGLPARDGASDSSALLAAYQLLVESTVESGADEVLLSRALAVLAAVPWQVPCRFFSAYLPVPESPALRLAAVAAGPAAPSSPCPIPEPAACLCGRALIRQGRLHSFESAAETAPPPCDPGGTGTHLVLPLGARGRVLGVLHALAEPGQPSGAPERAFFVQVATLLGAELHRRGAEREHDQLEMQFLQAQKMEAVGRLAGGVAHDFNNILTAITSYADLGLLKLPEQSPLRRNLNEILAAAERATLLTQQLLAFSRNQAHVPRVLDLNAVLAELGKTLRRLVGARVTLSIATGPAPARLVADPVLLEQLIINLVLSARDTVPAGAALALAAACAEVAAEPAHPATPPGSYVRLSFATGAGGPGPAAMLALCTPGPPAADAAGVASLGPAAVHDIVRECGGFARAERAADGGCALELWFPAAADGEQEGTAGSAQLPGGEETILLVEDDDSVRVVMTEILRDLGYQPLEAREAREALALAAAHDGRIDALLTDVELRGFGGRELFDRLAATRPDLRVLYVAGIADDIAGIPGAVSLPKPFSPWALAWRLRQVLDGRRAAPRGN